MENSVLQKDIESIVHSKLPVTELNNSTVLITGATGLIGSLIVKSLLLYNQVNQYRIRVLAMARSSEKARNVFAAFLEDPLLTVIYGDIIHCTHIDEEVDYIIHGASVTSSGDFVKHPVETIETALTGSRNILEMAVQKSVRGMVYLSSLEVYGVCDFNKPEIFEYDCGQIDMLSVRSSYSQSKRMVECLCAAYAAEYQVPVKIVRLTQTFGAGVQYNDTRVFAELARCIIEKRDIVLHTKGETVRNYCCTVDAVRGILTVLTKGTTAEAYNIANESTAISIADMALMLTEQYPDAGSRVVFELADEQQYGYNPVIKIRLNTNKIQQLGWKAEVDLPEMFDRLIRSMIEHENTQQ